jgi:hypothetical protein
MGGMGYQIRQVEFAQHKSYVAQGFASKKALWFLGFFLSMICLIPVGPERSSASAATGHENLSTEWGGHIRGRGRIAWPDDESFYGAMETGSWYDGSIDFRLKNKIFFGAWGYFETHYEAVFLGGDTWRADQSLAQSYPGLFNIIGEPLNDERRLMDLTRTVDEGDDYLLYHRLDRLSLTLQPEWGTIRLGRQVLTWGNGLIFNPMDLFNPFAPSDIERDYKIGDDMATVQCSVHHIGDLQFLYVPRRNPASHDVVWEESSLAGRLHVVYGTSELDFVGAKHYQDYVAGMGSVGYLLDAAWRMDATWTFLGKNRGRDGFLSLVANIDYAWVWRGHNFYGLLEFYFNGLGDNNYSKALRDPDLVERIARGELFTLGRTYLGGEIEMELHPLLRVYLTAINNLADPSGILQPRAIWDMAQNVEVTFGGNIYYGQKGTEYGGFLIPETNLFYKPSDNVFLWLTYFF